jgi:hypothetical protein
VENLFSIYRNTLIADPDLNAALAFLVVQVANDNENSNEQANKQIQSVTIHGGIPLNGQGCRGQGHFAPATPDMISLRARPLDRAYQR